MTKTEKCVFFVILVAVAVLTMSVGTVAGQSSVTEEFSETYGGPDNDTAESVVQTDDGGFAIAGETESFGSGESDAWLIKTDADGDEEFNRTYGGPGDDTAESVVQTSDGGFAIAGLTGRTGFLSPGDAWLIKTDANGNVEFKETFGGSNSDSANSIVQTNDGGYALAGATRSSFARAPGSAQAAWLIKTDPNGNVEINETFGRLSFSANSIVQTDDGGFAIAGMTDTFVGWLAKTDVNGNEEFDETFAFGDAPRPSAATSIVQTDDGGFVLSGVTGMPEIGAWLIKTDSSGSGQVNKTFGGGDGAAESVVQTDDGGFAIAGETETFGPSGDMRFIKTDSSGNEELNKTFGGSDTDGAESMIQTSDNDFALAGSTQSFGSGGEDAWLVGVSEGGVIEDSSFRIRPYPVEKGVTPRVSVNVPNADNVQIEVNGETKDMEDTFGSDKWTKEISSSVNDERGKRVNLNITAGNDTLSKIEEAYPRTQLPRDPDTEPGTEQLHYYVFEDTVETPVVLAKFDGQDLSEFNLDSKENVTGWQKTREYDMNIYMGSDRGSLGLIGYDLTYFDNNSNFHTVGPRSKYSNPGILTDDIDGWACKFARDAKRETSLAGGKEWVATHPGENTLGSAFIATKDIVLGDCGKGSAPTRGYMSMGLKKKNPAGIDAYGTWIHELSHLHLGMGDLYSKSGKPKGNVYGGIAASKTGIMGGVFNTGDPFFAGSQLPQPYSVLSRTELNDLMSLEPDDSADWPWANLSETKLGVNPETVPVKDANDINKGDTVWRVNTQKSGNEIPVGGFFGSKGEVNYLFEGTIGENTVRGYRIQIDGDTLNTATSIDSQIERSIDGETSNVKNSLYVIFDVDNNAVPQEVTVQPFTKGGTTTASITPSVSTDTEISVSGSSPIATIPDIDLRAVDSQGRVTGVNEDGEFVNEIPGAEASGDTTGREWISVPNDADVEFEVSSDDVQKFIDETEVSAENVTARYRTKVSTTGPNAEIVNESGNITVTDSTTKVVTENKSIDPGQTESAVDETVIAGFSRSPREASPGDAVTFDGSLSTDLDGSIQTYDWDFGDGTTATGETVTHTYSNSGTYAVELTVTDDAGTTDTTTVTVDVRPENLFSDPLPGFNNPPTNTQELDPTLYEDLNGDGDGLDPSEAVLLWSELVQNSNGFTDLSQEEVDKLDWNGDGNLTPADAVMLWSEKVQAASNS